MTKEHSISQAYLSNRNSGLDFLRGAAAFSVAISHFFVFGNGGSIGGEVFATIGVEVFFILSGFVLAPQIIQCLSNGVFALDFKIFIVRRWMRTIPPYVVALLAITFISSNSNVNDFFYYFIYAQNLFSVHIENDYFDVAWSLSVEEWFYLIFPLFLFLLGKILGLNALAGAVIFICFISVGREAFANFLDFDASVRRVVVFRLDSIALGFVLYLFHPKLSKLSFGVLFALCFSSLFAVLCSLGTFPLFAADIERTFFYLVPVFASSILMIFYKLDSAIKLSRATTFAGHFLGGISYPVYLFHITVLSILSLNEVQLGTHAWGLVVYLLVICSFAQIFHVYFELPILRSRPKFGVKAS